MHLVKVLFFFLSGVKINFNNLYYYLLCFNAAQEKPCECARVYIYNTHFTRRVVISIKNSMYFLIELVNYIIEGDYILFVINLII